MSNDFDADQAANFVIHIGKHSGQTLMAIDLASAIRTISGGSPGPGFVKNTSGPGKRRLRISVTFRPRRSESGSCHLPRGAGIRRPTMSDRFPTEPVRPSENEERINLSLRVEWTALELVESLKQGIDPAKTYRIPLMDHCEWLQLTGENLLILAPAVADCLTTTEEVVCELKGHEYLITARTVFEAVNELFEGMRRNGSSALQHDGDLFGIKQWLTYLEHPPREGVRTFWEDDAPIIEF